jgi:hypothetical protein
VLRDSPRALHVRLDGPPAARAGQAARIEGVDLETAKRRLAETDRAREAYVRYFLGPPPLSPRRASDREGQRSVAAALER